MKQHERANTTEPVMRTFYHKLAERHGWYTLWTGYQWIYVTKDFAGAQLDLNRAHAVRHGGLTIEKATAMQPSGSCSFCGEPAVVMCPQKLQEGLFPECLNCYEGAPGVALACISRGDT